MPNNMFQNFPVQTPDYSYDNGINWTGRSNMNMGMNQQPYGNGGFMNRTQTPSQPNIPVRVVFSPEQIAPQEIPTNGMPALFPLNDGSKIIVKSMLGNGLFDERVYVLQPQNTQNQVSEFDQVMMRLGAIENSLNQVLNDLYGSKSQGNQEGDANKNE